ncbi:DUF4232 domain-containing protein [Mycetocola zhadangensis]|uniref:DUF4232 domain-containing protein n=1 Tax=Mycetocola zhadangensis TaxID=1164595 RepID=A0A3L7J1F3_9MICO|nr:DUF4232 domain-containing protein [Mycetocola zhadangensis]RLQ84219.1 DUF4232 domain-containing protein [Mycetocola zhadangensis]GGE95024.1 hypothetical protein GCM10011313_17510 [Mycetocola zhadangensis]
MRLIRAGLPAAVAALLWLVSGGLELLGRQTLSGPKGHVLSLVAPETIPVQELTAPAPWSFLLIVLSMLAIFAAYAGLAAIVRREPLDNAAGVVAPYSGSVAGPSQQRLGNTATAFAAYWLCAVASGFLVPAIPVVIELLNAVVEQQTPIGLVAERVAGAAQWGLLYGWIPAAVAVAIETMGNSDHRVFARRMIAIPAAALFLIAAIGLTLAAPQAHAAVQAQIPTGPAPEPIPTGTPVPGVAPGEWQADPLWCTAGQLEMTAGTPDAATGHRALVMRATNVSDAACILEGYPDVAFADVYSNALDVSVDHGGTMLGSDPGVTRIEVEPGAAVVSTLGWSAMPTAGLETAGWLHLAAYAGAQRQMVTVETDITGGSVSVTAWATPPTETGEVSD